MIVTKLLKDNEKMYLDILWYILNNKATKSQVKEKFNLTNTKLNYLINRINGELELHNISGKIFVENGFVIYKEELETVEFNLVYFKLLKIYLEFSMSYYYLDLFIYEKEKFIVDVMETLNISMPYVYKVTKKVNTILKDFNLKIDIKEKRLILTGREEHILGSRYSYFCFIKSFNVKQVRKTHLNIPNDYELNDNEYWRYMVFAELTESRDVNKKRIQSLNKTGMIKKFLDILSIDSNKDIYILFKLIFFPNILTLDTIETYGKKLFKMKNKFLFTNEAVFVLESIEQEFHINITTGKQYYRYIYLLTLHLVYLDIFKQDFREFFSYSLEKNVVQEQSLYKQIVTFFSKIFKVVEVPTEGRETLCRTLYLLIVSSINIKVNIYIDFYGNITKESLLKNTLETIFNNNMLEFTKKIEKADIVITDYIVADKSDDKEYVYLQNIYEESMIKQIFELSSNKVKEKYFR
ncbi:hypothetical protein CUM91_11895 [Enterococcus faecalis]|uniref:helix-turn-helix domain-containing protein n=1 Tax=Enterococcus faecalis TaxID=1351 RepID=UPI000CF6F26F|nr:helix-turn-helix domain-containing protein [Enterococcus faecalis]PQC11817.1 hypothetical protein CUM91_11895 [Enterococcus faecalis]